MSDNRHQIEGAPSIRRQVFRAKTEQELIELLLAVRVELARRLERPDLDIDTYFKQYILPMCDQEKEETP